MGILRLIASEINVRKCSLVNTLPPRVAGVYELVRAAHEATTSSLTESDPLLEKSEVYDDDWIMKQLVRVPGTLAN